MLSDNLKKEIKTYYRTHFAKNPFVPGKTRIPHAQKFFDEDELTNAVEAVLDGWWTEGRFAKEFEREFSKFLGVRYVTLVNSGSSANLVAFASLTAHNLGKKAIKRGAEVITVAAAFPTTVSPIIQFGCTPVFVDVDAKTINATARSIRKALTKKTRAIMMAHTLGNPLPLDEIMKIVRDNDLWFIEDCCDALGSLYGGKMVGTFGHIATFSFYPAHHMTMGEGGAVVTNNPFMYRGQRQFRDWGRDCWCATGEDDTCRRRFGWKMGKLPMGYDHKFIYSEVGYNLKLTDMQAAIGLAQLKKLPYFIKKRQKNYQILYNHLKKYKKYFTLQEAENHSEPSWFGFMITLTDCAPFTRDILVHFLESRGIVTRGFYAGNLLKHPGYLNLPHYRISQSLNVSDTIAEKGFWIGVFPGLTDAMIHYMCDSFDEFMRVL